MDKYLQLDLELATNLGWTKIILDEGTAQIRAPNLIGVRPKFNTASNQIPFYSRDPYQTTNFITEYGLDINWSFDEGDLLVTVHDSDYESTITEKVKEHINRKKCLSYAVAKVVNLIIIERINKEMSDLIEHQDDKMIDTMAVILKAHLKEKRDQGYNGWDNPELCSINNLLNEMHVAADWEKLVDTAIYALMVSYRQQVLKEV